MIPILISSETKWPPRVPDPKWTFICSGLKSLKVVEFLELKGEWAYAASGFNFTLSDNIHVFDEPVSNKAINFYGGLPTYM